MTASLRRPTVLEVDLAAVRANVELLSRLSAPAVCCVVVKADGYGHGAVAVARAALEAGADELAVATVDEALELRDAAIGAPILQLAEPWDLDAAREAVRADVNVAVGSLDGLRMLADAAAAERRVARVEVKVDTGMHRYGVDRSTALDLIEAVAEAPMAKLSGMWTHLAVADDPARPETDEQLDRFERIIDTVVAAGVGVPRRHAANSAGAIAIPRARYDLVRCGIAAYGIAPSPAVGALAAGLRPALRLRSRVARVARVGAGEGVGYGLSGAASRERTIATVPIGYADGVDRRLGSAGGEVLIGGRRRPVVGAVTMDHLMVDCGDDSVQVGDEVVLVGEQGEERVSATEWAALLGTIPYEIVSRIGPRVPRRYLSG